MRYLVIAALVTAGVVLVGCEGNGTPGEAPERVLIGGLLPDPNQNDCRWLEQSGQDPIPGVNCDEPERLLSFIESTGANVHVALVDFTVSPEVYGSDPEYMTCTYKIGGAFDSALVATTQYTVLDDFGKAEPGVERLVFGGPCQDPSEPVCGLGLYTGRAYVTSGENLVFFARNCCLETWKPGSWSPIRIYPVQEGVAYDWDGKSVPMTTVRTAIESAIAAGPKVGAPDYNIDCEKVGGTPSIALFPNRAEFENARQ